MKTFSTLCSALVLAFSGLASATECTVCPETFTQGVVNFKGGMQSYAVADGGKTTVGGLMQGLVSQNYGHPDKEGQPSQIGIGWQTSYSGAGLDFTKGGASGWLHSDWGVKSR
jgi:hypothetical protein